MKLTKKLATCVAEAIQEQIVAKIGDGYNAWSL